MRIHYLLDMTPRYMVSEIRKRILKKKKISHFDDNHRCIFVLSTGRTGTKTLSALISLSADFLSYHEPNPRLFRLSSLAYSVDEEIGVNQVFLEAFLIARKQLLDYSLNCGKGYAETGHHVTFLADIILQAIPEVRFIHLVRDPRDVVISSMRRNWYSTNRFDKDRISPKAGTEYAAEWKNYSPFEKNVWLWMETNKWIMNFMASLPTDKGLLIHSEDIFEGKDHALIELFGFLGTEVPSPGKIDRLLRKRLNAQKKGKFPISQDWSRSMDEQFIKIAGKTAKALNYEV
jgi:hypothetical protein